MSHYNNDDDLTQIHANINDLEDKSLNRTRRMKQLLSDTKQVGASTNEELVRQGEKLRSIDRTLDDIDHDINENQKEINKLKGIKGYFTRVKGVFKGDKHKKKDKSNTDGTASGSSKNKESKKNKKANGNLKFEDEPQPAKYATITGSEREKGKIYYYNRVQNKLY
jgi:septal ring factor EnvC (AmiA/AmiB activator)